ncbi:MAG TPA: hypothetical protein DD636_08850 [Anaerolineaceae bacterium]|jgi:hypothetical protein|nr:hypothetical protein [Anaerolineaceae bacterium]
MKRISLILAVVLVAISIAGCGSSSEPTQAPALVEPNVQTSKITSEPNLADPNTVTFEYEYENAISRRLMLSFGILKLADTDVQIDKEQASQFLFLWQALSNLTNSGTSADAEVDALLSQIELVFTPEQISAINAMKLTQTDMQTWAQENGITFGSGTGSEQTPGQGMGQGSGMTDDERATKQAENGMTGNSTSRDSGISSAITKALISYLENFQ